MTLPSGHGAQGAGGGHTGERRGRRRTDRAPTVRLAAVGDFHCGEGDAGVYREMFARVNDEADLLLLAGDLTRRGTPAEMRVVAGELADVRIPILAVFGNHDHESGQIEEATAILRERGVHVLDGDIFNLNEQVGVVGIKGFMGGFGRWTLTAFGEAATKSFVGSTVEEAQRLEFGLRRLDTPIRVVLMHYSPTIDTVRGEPEQIFPFLGNDRLAEPLDRFGASVVFHGHAHHGTFQGATPGGVPVFNVSHVLLKENGHGDLFFIYEIPLPAEEGEEADAVQTGAGAAGSGS